jgi:hypothetical protein
MKHKDFTGNPPISYFTDRSNLMNKSRIDRLSPLSGAAAVVIMVAGVLIFNYYEFLPPAEKLAGFFNNNAYGVYAGGYIASLSAFTLLWFAGSVRSVLAEREGGTGHLSTIAFGGGAAASVVLGVSFVGILTSGLRAGAAGGITPIGAVSLYDFYSQLTGQLLPIFMAVFIAATAAVSRRTKLFPAWFDGTSLIVVVGLLTPFAYMMLALAIAWLLVVSLWLYLRGASMGAPATAAEAV